MTARWWRAHASALDDPKVQRLPGDLFKSWFNVLCIACQHEGTLPPIADVAFALRKSESATAAILAGLKNKGLLDQTDSGLTPHNWNGRQYKSDVSTERVQQFRKRQRNVSVTPSESETEADTESEGAKAPPSPPRRKPADDRIKLPSDWRPEVDDQHHASDKGLDPESTVAAFTDHFCEGNGRNQKRTRAGWSKRFRIWCNKDADARPSRVPGVRPARNVSSETAAFARAGARLGGEEPDW